MEPLDRYRIDLKELSDSVLTREFNLDNQFFIDVEASEVVGGQVHVALEIKKMTAGDAFEFHFNIDGKVSVPCDRCLDEMELEVASSDKVMVRMGDDYSDDGEWIVVPEEEGEVNVAWIMYEFIALALPLTHTHALGECNEVMAEKLNEYLSIAEDDDMVGIEMDEDEDLESTSQTLDPRWNELKKILDNN